MNRLFAKRIGWCAFALTAHASAVAPDSFEMTTECVGRMQLRIPKNFDVAVNPFKFVVNKLPIQPLSVKFSFADSQDAGYSDQYYFGSILISETLKENEKQEALLAAKKAAHDTKIHVSHDKRDGGGRPLVYESLPVEPFVGFADRVNASLLMTLLVGDHLVKIQADAPDEQQWSQSNYRNLLSGIHPRAQGEIPSAPGVCLPYVFIQDDGTAGRTIGTTYRLADHPDITIWLEDSSSAQLAPGMDPKKFTADHDNEFFWGQDYQAFSKGHLVWFEPHSVKLNGVKGVSTFMELTRQDGTIDYGYFAASRGNRKTADSSDLKMYVIRDSKNAISKGIKPMDKDDFIKLAETIAASVTQRPTDAH